MEGHGRRRREDVGEEAAVALTAAGERVHSAGRGKVGADRYTRREQAGEEKALAKPSGPLHPRTLTFPPARTPPPGS